MSTTIKVAPVSATLAPAYCVYVKMCCLHAQQNHSAYVEFLRCLRNFVHAVSKNNLDPPR